jgi:hypothetical protein
MLPGHSFATGAHGVSHHLNPDKQVVIPTGIGVRPRQSLPPHVFII